MLFEKEKLSMEFTSSGRLLMKFLENVVLALVDCLRCEHRVLKKGQMEMRQDTGSSMEILVPCANGMCLIPNILIENFDDGRW
ncbi:hypothetical protein C5167_041728 [Papaver somniferum]|nr:hypothetical protein C5167_041728 [Papaver somniferum]